eukprot:CAMPEP_0201685684 /NCGR_PEP_ID=MMETSP0578-20130828/376_1 /ASSEMBLY_ACC=CAM_ASM_000663 /TAXON_ID=267565 /ORGANISM="Skeletonema grethea, Strain CCMP 1804" /LENGTH=441 /DNA_ID=CAMNT_0048169625 /DNA_START=47 /DNA_END=1372 /DNA_ORIENTATION=-
MSMLPNLTSSQLSYLGLLGGLKPPKKKAKKAKKKYNNWFEKLTLTELKSLCRASKLAVSGTKDELCIRLCNGELSSDYAYEYAPERFSRARFEAEMPGYGSCDELFGASAASLPPAQQGSKRDTAYTNQQLKDMCKSAGLIVSGKRYDLVLRLLQNESGVGGAPKRAAGTIDEETGVFQPKKRAKSMKPPNVEKLQERIFKKCFPSDEVKHKWSNNKYKYHPSDCMTYMSNIIEKEIFEKELFERGEEKCAWELINVILNIITFGNEARRKEWAAEQAGSGSRYVFMIGGTDFELNRCSDDLKLTFLPQLVKAMKATSKKTVVAELSGKLLWAFQSRKLAEIPDWDEYDINDRPDDWRTPRKYGSFKETLNEFVPRKGESSTEESDEEEEEEPQPRFFSVTKISGEPEKTQELTYSATAGFQPVASKQQEEDLSNGREFNA